MFQKSGEIFTEVGKLFKDTNTSFNLEHEIEVASKRMEEIARIEEEAWTYLSNNI